MTQLPTPPELLTAATRTLGSDWLLWEPETIRAEARAAPELPKHAALADALCAISVVKRTDLPWTEVGVFESVVEALNWTIPDHSIIEGVDLGELYFGVAAMHALRESPEPTFDDDVARYCAAVHVEAGVFAALDPLGFCNSALREFRSGELFWKALAALSGKPQGGQYDVAAKGLRGVTGALQKVGL